LAEEMALKPNDEVLFRGQTFRVEKIHPQRGSKDDITVWIDLEAAQGILGLAGRINMIQALECNCASVDRLAEIQAEISGLLGNEVQVIELSTTAIARAKAREGVKAEGQATIDRWRSEGQAMIGRLERLASVLLPLVIIGASTLVGLLSLLNVRERRAEIGILRALGTGTRKIMTLFVTKALILGALGSVVGYALGFLGAWSLDMPGAWSIPDTQGTSAIFRPELLICVLLVTPMLAAIASWLPAIAAAQQDPAVVLREE
jgi:ABC-type lipoprotein release transport system permease subunit